MKNSPPDSPPGSKPATRKPANEPLIVPGDSFTLSETELFSQLPQALGPRLFLDHFTLDEMEVRLESSGFRAALCKRGVLKPRVEIQWVEPGEHRLLIYDDGGREPVKMVELRLVQSRLEVPALPGHPPISSYFEMLVINWAMLQNPRTVFSAERPRLPGQEHPGLGLGRKCHEFLVNLARELQRDGLINHPQYFHNAIFYLDEYFFVDPLRQGELLAMARDLSRYPVAVSSPAIAEGKLVDETRRISIEWRPGAMVCPVEERLKSYFESREYREAVQRAKASHSYDLAQ